jgi:hypothetical protein
MNRRQRLDRDHLAGRHTNHPEDDCFGCAFNEREAYASVAGEMYIPGEIGYQTPEQVLDGLEPVIVAIARDYATKRGLDWPPVVQ